MAKDVSKQQIANLIQAYEQVVRVARQMYDDTDAEAEEAEEAEEAQKVTSSLCGWGFVFKNFQSQNFDRSTTLPCT